MNRLLQTISTLIIFVSCKPFVPCDFNSYLQNVPTLKNNFTFKTTADLNTISKSNFCDTIYFGQNSAPVGIIGRQQGFISFLIVDKGSNDKIYLKTLDTTGKLVDMHLLEQFNGMVNDTLKQWTTYQLKSSNMLLRTDTCELPMYAPDGEKVTVRTAVTDTFLIVNGRITR